MWQWLGFVAALGAFAVYANPNEQTRFQRSVSNDAVQYSYAWQDHNDTAQSIEFTLDPMALRDLPNQQANYKHRMAMRYVATELLQHAKSIDPRTARVNVRQLGDQIDVAFRSQNQTVINQLKSDFMNKQDMAYSKYLRDHYYMLYKSALGDEAVKPDHIRYITAYTKALIPASQAFYDKLGDGTDARDYLNLLLSWVQSIPYSELSNRAESNGAGFSPPVTLLNTNLGDCDSKSVLAAAMIRAFLPTVPMRLVLLPEHALLGVAISQRKDDDVLNEGGLQLVLMEPTGPAPLAFGQVGQSSRELIARDLYVLESVP